MTNQPLPNGAGTSHARPVLIWRPEPDESHVKPSVEQAAQFLNASADAIVEGIETGDLVQGWFVDWDLSGATVAAAAS